MYKKATIAIFYILSSLFIFSSPVHAKVMYQEKGNLTIAKDQVIEDDLFIGSENVQIDGIVTGSVYVGAGMVEINGSIKGDLVVGAGEVRLSGNVFGDVYAGSGRLDLIKGNINGSLVSGAGEINIDKDSKVGGSLIAGTGDFTNYGAVGRSLMVGSGKIYQDSKVGKEARLGGGEIELGPNSIIGGDLTYALGEENSQLTQAESASVGGTTARYTPPVDAKNEMARAKDEFNKFGYLAKRGWLLVSFLGSLLLGIILLKLMPKTMSALSAQLKTSPMANLGAGLLIILLAGPTLLILALTIVGIPLVVVAIPLLCLAIHLAKLVASFALGRWISTQFNLTKLGTIAIFALGLASFYLLKSLPPIGWLVSMLFTWTGLGAIWSYAGSNRKNY